jgi:hypothetical protein
MISFKKKLTRHQTCRGKEVYRVGMGAGGQWAAGEGVVDDAHGFCVVKISSSFRCARFSIGRFRSQNSDASLYLKLWYSFYISAEYQRLHEHNLVRRRKLMWVVTTTTCRQLGNDTTYNTEKKNTTSHDVADTLAVSGRRVGKTRRHVVKTNSGRHLKRRHFQLRMPPLGDYSLRIAPAAARATGNNTTM